MSRGTRLAEKEFDNIKLLTGKGMKQVEIAKVTGRSDDTVRRVKNSKNYQDYLKNNKEERNIRNEREALKPLTIIQEPKPEPKPMQPLKITKTEQPTVKLSVPIRIETPEADMVQVVETPETVSAATIKEKVADTMEALEIRNPLKYEEFTVRAIEGKFGRYFRDVTSMGDYIDYESKDGEELSMTIEQWKQFIKELKRAAQVLGVTLE